MTVSWPFMIQMSSYLRNTIDSQRNLEDDQFNFIVSTVFADALAPLGARTSVFTVLAKFKVCVSIRVQYLKC